MKTNTAETEKWALQAVSPKEDGRLSIQTAACINGQLAASDGQRLHIVENYTKHTDGGLRPDGSYIPEAEREEEYGRFPNYLQVIPYDPQERPNLVWEIGPGTGKDATRETMIGEEKTRLSERCFKEATAGMKAPRFYMADEMNPLLIKDAETNRLAVIMPFRIM